MNALFKKFINPEIITTERLRLRKINRNDLYDVYEYASDPSVSKYLLWSPHGSLSYTRIYLGFIEKKYRRGEFYDWGIEYQGKMIGTSGFTSLSPENKCGEIGFVLNSRYWGAGIAVEAASAVIKYGFEELNLNRIEARYMLENSQSRRVMEKCNMKYEGTLRDGMLVKGSFRDIGVYSILRKEYLEKE